MNRATDDLQGRLQNLLGDSFQVDHELSRGGMSRVFLATDTKLGRQIVFKVLPPELAAEVSVERFNREIQVAAQLSHPHIVPLLNAGSDAGLLYYTMPFVEGESLRSLLDRERQLPIEQAIQFAREAADALDYAHRRTIVHRDIKPENILLADDHAVVADFGIARAVSQATGELGLTSATITLGTPAYMSPEQASGEREIDGRSDIYSLSCVLYEMLTGEAPFKGSTQQAIIAKRFLDPAPRVRVLRTDVPQWLDDVVACGLATSPLDRFPAAKDLKGALGERSSDGIPSPNPRPVASSAKRRRLRYGVIAAGAIIVLGIVAFLVSDSRDAKRQSVAQTATGPATIAVIPFANLSPDPANEFFADGMTEELINALSGIEGLRVAARSSVFALKGKQLDAKRLGDTLGVSSVLEGSVRRSGSQLRVTAQLVNASDGLQIWTENYNREMSDVFKLQDDIARAIVSALRVKLIRTSGASPATTRPTGNTEAYDLYLKGKFFLNNQGTQGNPRALELFERALSLDSSFARAYAGVADSRSRIGMLGIGSIREEMPKAKAAALRAVELDSTLAEAHSALAHILFVWDWDHRGAEREFRKAISLDPDYATTRWLYGILLLDQARFSEAEREFRTAHELEPLLPHTSSLFGRYFVATKQSDSAIKYLRNAIDLGPNLDLALQQLGHAYLQKNMGREAIDVLRKAAQLAGARDSAHLVYAYAVTGNQREAEAVLARILVPSEKRALSPVDVAVAYAGLGKKDEAFRWLERGLSQRAPFMDNIRVMPGLESLRSDPRFADLVRRVFSDIR